MPVDGTVPEKNRGCQVLFLFLFLFYADKVTCTLHDYRNVITALLTKERNSHGIKSAAQWFLPTVLASVGFHKHGMRDECKLNINHKEMQGFKPCFVVVRKMTSLRIS